MDLGHWPLDQGLREAIRNDIVPRLGRLTRKYAEYAAQTLHPEADAKKVEQWQQRQAALVEAIEHLEHELSEVKQLQSQTPKHLAWEDLPEEAQFQQLAPSRKRLLDHLTAAEMTCPGTNLKLAYSLFGPNP